MVMPDTEVAAQVGYTVQRVRQINSDPQALCIREVAVLRMREKMMDDIEESLLELTDAAVKRIAETLQYEDFIIGSDGKKHQDNLSLGFLKAGILSGRSDSGKDGSQSPPLNEKLSTRLIEALEESNKADKLYNESKEIVVRDAEIVETT